MAYYRIVMINGAVVELRNADLIEDGSSLQFQSGETRYRFNPGVVAYIVERKR